MLAQAVSDLHGLPEKRLRRARLGSIGHVQPPALRLAGGRAPNQRRAYASSCEREDEAQTRPADATRAHVPNLWMVLGGWFMWSSSLDNVRWMDANHIFS